MRIRFTLRTLLETVTFATVGIMILVCVVTNRSSSSDAIKAIVLDVPPTRTCCLVHFDTLPRKTALRLMHGRDAPAILTIVPAHVTEYALVEMVPEHTAGATFENTRVLLVVSGVCWSRTFVLSRDALGWGMKGPFQYSDCSGRPQAILELHADDEGKETTWTIDVAPVLSNTSQ